MRAAERLCDEISSLSLSLSLLTAAGLSGDGETATRRAAKAHDTAAAAATKRRNTDAQRQHTCCARLCVGFGLCVCAQQV